MFGLNAWHLTIKWGSSIVFNVNSHTNICDKGSCSSLLSPNFDDQLSSNVHKFVFLCKCWDTPNEKTGLWQLPIASSAFNYMITKDSPASMCSTNMSVCFGGKVSSLTLTLWSTVTPAFSTASLYVWVWPTVIADICADERQ